MTTNRNSFKINRFIVARSGQYHKQFTRPFAAMAGHDQLDELISTTRNGNVIDPFSLNLQQGNIMKISTTAGMESMIDNGWDLQRNVFMLDVEGSSFVGEPDRFIFTGYTSHDAIGSQFTDDLDPNVVLYFNNVIVLKSFRDGAGQIRYQIADANQILRNVTFNPQNNLDTNVHVSDQNGFHTTMEYNLQGEVSNHIVGTTHLRPLDTIRHLEQENMRSMDIGDDHQDGTYFLSPAQRNQEAQFSKYTNNIPNSYLARSLNALRVVDNNYDGGDYGARFDAAQRQDGIVESTLSGNTLLFNLLQHTENQANASVSWSTLCGFFPEINYQGVKSVIRDGGAANLMNYSYWTGRDATTIAAATVCAMVPGLMFQCGMAVAAIQVTNNLYNHFDESPYHIEWVFDEQGGRYILGWLANNLPEEQLAAKFTDLIKTQLMPALTKNNTIAVNATINVSIYKDAIVSISLDNEPLTTYANPAFASGLISPLLGSSGGAVSGIADTLMSIDCALSSARTHAPRIVSPVATNNWNPTPPPTTHYHAQPATQGANTPFQNLKVKL